MRFCGSAPRKTHLEPAGCSAVLKFREEGVPITPSFSILYEFWSRRATRRTHLHSGDERKRGPREEGRATRGRFNKNRTQNYPARAYLEHRVRLSLPFASRADQTVQRQLQRTETTFRERLHVCLCVHVRACVCVFARVVLCLERATDFDNKQVASAEPGGAHNSDV